MSNNQMFGNWNFELEICLKIGICILEFTQKWELKPVPSADKDIKKY